MAKEKKKLKKYLSKYSIERSSNQCNTKSRVIFSPSGTGLLSQYEKVKGGDRFDIDCFHSSDLKRKVMKGRRVGTIERRFGQKELSQGPLLNGKDLC